MKKTKHNCFSDSFLRIYPTIKIIKEFIFIDIKQLFSQLY